MIKGDGTDKAKRPCCLNRLEAIRRSSILVGLRGYRLHRGRQREAQESGPDIMDTSTCYKQGDGSETSGRLWQTACGQEISMCLRCFHKCLILHASKGQLVDTL